MPSGFLGAVDLTDTNPTVVYTVDAGKCGTVNFYATNRNATPVKVRWAVVDGSLPDLAPRHWLEFDATIQANEPLERSGIPVSAGVIVARTDTPGVSASVKGFIGVPALGEE